MAGEQHQRLKAEFPDLAPICEWYIFSEKEMQEAEWFTMRSTNEKLEDSCPEKTFSHSCYASNYFNPPLISINISTRPRSHRFIFQNP